MDTWLSEMLTAKGEPDIEENKNIAAIADDGRLHGWFRMCRKKVSVRAGRTCKK